jgi:hypothetical protein
MFFLYYFGLLWLITTQVKTSDFGVKGGRNGGGPLVGCLT